MAVSSSNSAKIADVLRQIRAEVREIRSPSAQRSVAPGSPLVPRPPDLYVSSPKEGADKLFIEAEQRALGKTEVSRWIPKVLRRLFRRQGGFNKEILRVVRLLNKQQRQTAKRVDEIVAYVRAENGWFDGVISGFEKLARRLETFDSRLLSLNSKTVDIRSELSHLHNQEEHVRQLSAAIDDLTASVQKDFDRRAGWQTGLEQKLNDLDKLSQAVKADFEGLAQSHRAVAEKLDAQHAQFASEARVNEQRTRVDGISDIVGAIREGLVSEARAREGAESRLAAQSGRLDSLSETVHALGQTIKKALATLEEQQIAETAYVKRQLHLHSSTLSAFSALTGPARRRKAATLPPAEANDLNTREFESFYLAFEDKFRGSRRDIKERVKVYLPLVKKARAGKPGRPVVDLGCGRGEWLELLRDEKLVGQGVDLNEFMVTECVERRLDVLKGNALDHLVSLPAETVGGITAFHVIEHLPFRSLLTLCAESLRVLLPGGVLILETPNPDNLQVGANRFYSDPTHLHPLPHELTRFVMAAAGFKKIELLPLHPDVDAIAMADEPSALERLSHRLFFGPQDYAVIGRK